MHEVWVCLRLIEEPSLQPRVFFRNLRSRIKSVSQPATTGHLLFTLNERHVCEACIKKNSYTPLAPNHPSPLLSIQSREALKAIAIVHYEVLSVNDHSVKTLHTYQTCAPTVIFFNVRSGTGPKFIRVTPLSPPHDQYLELRLVDNYFDLPMSGRYPQFLAIFKLIT